MIEFEKPIGSMDIYVLVAQNCFDVEFVHESLAGSTMTSGSWNTIVGLTFKHEEDEKEFEENFEKYRLLYELARPQPELRNFNAFQPDMIWVKQRGQSTSIIDTNPNRQTDLI